MIFAMESWQQCLNHLSPLHFSLYHKARVKLHFFHAAGCRLLESQEEASLSRLRARQQAAQDRELVAHIVSDIFARVQQQLLQEDHSHLRRLEVQLQTDIEALNAQQALAVEGECRELMFMTLLLLLPVTALLLANRLPV